MQYCAVLFLALVANHLATALPFELSLRDAESQALSASWTIKAAASDVTSSAEQEKSGFTAILPRVSIQGSYTYVSTLPQIAFLPNTPPLTFGDNHNYSFGPAISYTLWDTFSSVKAYAALGKATGARKQDQENTKIQVLSAVRSAYLRVQLAIEELNLVDGSVKLARSQEREVQKRFSAGAATVLETYPAKRQVLRFLLQHQQQQADVATFMKDLLSLTNPEMAHEAKLTFEMPRLEPLSKTLSHFSTVKNEAPSDAHPHVKSLELLSESSRLMAESLKAKLFPTLQLSMSSTIAYPNGPQLININQNTFGLSLNIPLFLGDPTWNQIEQRLSEARATHYRARQAKLELSRDYEKAQELIASLKEQQKLARQDIRDSVEVARLYYNSFKAGKLNFIDVQTANNDALQSRVNAARIDAQLISQIISLLAIEGKEGTL